MITSRGAGPGVGPAVRPPTVAGMESRRAGDRALGLYRAPWHESAIPFLLGGILVFTGFLGREHDWWNVAGGLFLFAAGLLPAAIVRRSGIILPRRLSRFSWGNVVAIQEVDISASRECLRARLADGRIVPLAGVPAHRLPGLVQLAEDHRRASPD